MCAQIILVPSLTASNIFGSVTDSLQQAVDVATVSLFRTTDSTFIKAEYTSTNGTFEFVEIPAGTYYVVIAVMGYEEFHSDPFTIQGPDDHFTIPAIQLRSAGLTLGEVSVVAQRPFIERRSDRLIVNVEGSILSSGASAMDVLENLRELS